MTLEEMIHGVPFRPKVIIPSVMHTGTKRTRKFLSGSRKVGVATPMDIVTRHTYPKEMLEIEQRIKDGWLVVAPMRNPEDCWKGWLKRGKGGQDGLWPEGAFVTQWRNLMSLPVNFWVPIDVPDRDEYLDALESVVSLATRDWKLVGYQEPDGGSLPYRPMPHVPGLRVFASQFGYRMK